ISGRVLLDDGEGARGVVVALLSADPDARVRVAARTKTGADGRYLLSDVPPGRYWVTPRAPSYVLDGLAGTFPPGRQVIVEAGEAVEDFDFKLARGGVITGRVTNAEGRPLVRETVVVSAAGPNRLENSTGTGGVYRGTTDDRGVYRVYGLPAGGYRVSAGRGEDENLGPAPGGFYSRVYYPGATGEAEAKVVEVKAGEEVGDVDIKLGARAQTFRVSGRVVGEGGRAVPGVALQYAAAARGGDNTGWSGGALSDARGEFSLDGLAPGRYTVFTRPKSRPSNTARRRRSRSSRRTCPACRSGCAAPRASPARPELRGRATAPSSRACCRRSS
ncbi:MAG TPA: carboxypeptidase-like regulatory domain-containing protein, partial [Pyrinomonadaceae bacterium]|nr:carboxypeptidase-like regulatory domain-containing protein [Pyrinomonadaceae bacterium]